MELIALTKWPTMAAPWQSADEGEAWLWGDFVLSFQREPQTVGETLEAMMKGSERMPQTLIYHYAMTVFYKKHKNPHGPSSRPVLSVGIEQIAGVPSAPIMIGMFLPTVRYNLGVFEAELTAENAKAKLFEIVAGELKIQDEPIALGAIENVFGHPETGWEEKSKPSLLTKSAGRKNKGCFSVLIVILLFVLWLV